MALYYVRHGKTIWNKIHRVQGRKDIPLCEEGIEEAKITRDLLKDIPFTRCYVSPLKRTQQTADIILEGREDVLRFTENRIIEFYYGEYEGASRLAEDYLVQRKKYFTRYPGGEGYLDVAARVYGFLKELETNYPDEDILLVAHGGLSRVVHSYFYDMDNEEFSSYILGNCAVQRYEWPHRKTPLIQQYSEDLQ